MKRSIIVAMTPHRLIGNQGRLPWHEPEDLKHFKCTTIGHAVIMGRKTFESIGRPLPERRNIVVTRNPSFTAAGIDSVRSLDDALTLCLARNETAAFIIGGAEIYRLALPLADEMIVTWVDRDGLTGEAFFPEWNPAEWEEMESSSSGPLRFVTYRRVNR